MPSPPRFSIITVLRRAFSPPALDRHAPEYFHGIDLLRGLAALSILFWHYVHFFTVGQAMMPHRFSDSPLYPEFWVLYEHGGNAVQLFWLISGFTFSGVYTRKRVSARVFAAHRFARLYPLHLVTLLVVAALQIASVRLTGMLSIYGDNDLPHFIDQLFLTSGWGPVIRFSFNGPIWTVSVELLMYALFRLLLPRLFVAGCAVPLGIAAVSLALSRLGPFAQILQGGFFYFTGCALYPVFLASRERRWTIIAAGLIPLAAAAALFARWHAVGPGSTMLFVGMVFVAGSYDPHRGQGGANRAMKWLGDNTYGTYLWHVPVQIIILITVAVTGVGTELFRTPWFLLGYLLIVVGIARLSFLFIERPSRTWLNGRFA